MTIQSEQSLENNLLAQLVDMKYERISVPDEATLIANLRSQLEKHNRVEFSDSEFARVLNHLSKGSVFERAKTLRDKFHLVRDDSSSLYVDFFNQKEWCQNLFQVTNQTTMEGSYKNRYDVTILINGLPLVQIELKRRGLELKEAFNQTNRYQRHSYGTGVGLFQFIQVFVISNGVNTKYYANNRRQSFKFTSYWTDKDNRKISELSEFTAEFLEPCHIAKMIAHYTVLAETKTLMLLRPYQYYAVEAIIDKVKAGNGGGYIWHTTGSGKTLTSFKASQVINSLPDVDKVVFVVDRNDLDTQTIREFNSFQEGSVDTTDNTGTLVKQLNDPNNKLIVTTIQKLNNAVSNSRHAGKMEQVRGKRIVFIFDECHRSQFGETHKKITEYFTNHQLFGFTGTPIFADNASGNAFGKRTTKDLFGDRLHTYTITEAIGDGNVLKFSVEYVGKYRYKDSTNERDIEVEAIDTRELMESEERLEKIVDYILNVHSTKTHNRDYSAIFAVSSTEVLAKYYDILKRKQAGANNPLRIATIFSYTANEDDKDADGNLETNLSVEGIVNQHSRDRLESYIADYNRQYGTNFNTRDNQGFYSYYRDIGIKLKNREKEDNPHDRIDILLVVNMFLTGFDAKKVNTMYVDKNLRYHGLLQAYSRTNRIINETKSHGNIVSFRNLKGRTDEALALFANKEAKEVIFLEPYQDYVAKFNASLSGLKLLTPRPRDVDKLVGEEAQVEFVMKFRELLRLRNILVSFADFTFDHTAISSQEFEDYKSKYLDIYDRVRESQEKDKTSILEDVDFELELVRRDEINVDYILKLVGRLVGANDDEKREIMKAIGTALAGDAKLRSKRELIEKFIKGTVPKIESSDDVEDSFAEFWNTERQNALKRIVESEGLNEQRLESLVERYIFTNRTPKKTDFGAVLVRKPSILERDTILSRIRRKFTEFIETFVDDV